MLLGVVHALWFVNQFAALRSHALQRPFTLQAKSAARLTDPGGFVMMSPRSASIQPISPHMRRDGGRGAMGP